MRVAHISDCYLPRTGGIELQVRGLSQAQLHHGESPSIITATPARRGRPVIGGETDHGVPVHRLALDLPGGLPVTPHVGGRLRNLLLESADGVHVHGGLVSVFGWPALRTAAKAGLPVVVSVHSVWSGWSRAFSAANAVSGWREWPIVWTTVSEVAAVPLRSALNGSSEVRVLHNGIDLAAWRPPTSPAPSTDSGSESSDPHSEEEIVIVSVARLAVRKRGLALIDMLERTREAVPPHRKIRAILIGDGPDRGRIERSLTKRGMTWVQCVGWQDHQQIREHYASSDIFISPSKLESFGIAALEARTAGLPVVALASSGVNEFITDRVDGLLVNDDAGLVAAMAELVVDDSLRAQITAHNRAVEPPFGWDSIVKNAD